MKRKIIDFLSHILFLNQYYSGMASIFMLHRVAPFENNKLIANENMKVSPEFLENFILNLKQKGYNFISLDRLFEILKNNESTKKQILFTLDDGYVDNFKIAYPIFKKHNVPFCIYITTSFIENKSVLWWYVLEDLIINNTKITLNNIKYFCKTEEEKNEVFLQVRKKILSFNKENFKERIFELFDSYNINWHSKCKNMSMNWDMVKELSKDSMVTIAGHTQNHLAFNKLSKNDIINEIVGANIQIEKKINMKIEHFAYPFGSAYEVGMREFKIIKNLNLKTATTTRYGNIYAEHKNHLESLPRIMLTEKFQVKNIGKVRRKKVVTL